MNNQWVTSNPIERSTKGLRYSKIYKQNLKKIRAGLGPGKVLGIGSRALTGGSRWIEVDQRDFGSTT